MIRSKVFWTSVALLATGCATQEMAWDKPGASSDQFYRESGQCRAQALSLYGPATQKVVVFQSCMAGQGWYQVPAQK